MSTTHEITNNLTQKLATAVAHREEFSATYGSHTFYVWMDQAIPVITVVHSEQGTVFEELASDKPSVMAQMLAPWLNND